MGSESNWSGELEGGISGRGLEPEERLALELRMTFEGGNAVANSRDLNSWSMVYKYKLRLLRYWVLRGWLRLLLRLTFEVARAP